MSIDQAVAKLRDAMRGRSGVASRHLGDAELRAVIEDTAAGEPLSEDIIKEAAERAVDVVGEIREGNGVAD